MRYTHTHMRYTDSSFEAFTRALRDNVQLIEYFDSFLNQTKYAMPH